MVAARPVIFPVANRRQPAWESVSTVTSVVGACTTAKAVAASLAALVETVRDVAVASELLFALTTAATCACWET